VSEGTVDGRVTFEVRGGAAYLTFDNPRLRNAMTWRMYEQLVECCDAIDGDSGVRVAVLRGAGGKAFVAGTDIAQFSDFAGGEDGLEYEAKVESIISRLESVRVPTIAAVEGFAVGGGLALAAACDLRLCTPDARFGVPIARTLGNCLSSGNHARLIALLGVTRTKDLLMTARLMDAAEALGAGFVREVVEPAKLDQAVARLVEQLCSNAPITLRVTKESIRRLTIEGSLDDDDLLSECYGSEDFREGVAAFNEKRKPVWRGR
jgi:enoyl-CoA hydratase